MIYCYKISLLLDRFIYNYLHTCLMAMFFMKLIFRFLFLALCTFSLSGCLLSGSNSTSVPTGSVALSAADPLTGPSNISMLNVTVTNNGSSTLTVNSLASSNTSVMNIVSGDSNHPNLCNNSTLAPGGNCTLWLQAFSQSSLGTISPNLNVTFTPNGGNQTTQGIPVNVTTSLYVAGHYNLDSSVSCYISSGVSGGNCDNLSRFDGSNWYQVAGGPFTNGSTMSSADPIVRDMIVANGKLYVAGNFTNLSLTGASSTAYYVAAWNGAAWDNLNTNSSTFLSPTNTSLFQSITTGGIFAKANMLAFDANNNVLYFNRVYATNSQAFIYNYPTTASSPSWSTTGTAPASGATTVVNSMLYDNTTAKLYLSGDQNSNSAGSGTPLLWIWNGSSWSAFTPASIGSSTVGYATSFISGANLYSYYRLTSAGAVDSLASCSLPLGTDCTLTAIAASTSSNMIRSGLTGLDPNGTSLVVAGTSASPSLNAITRSVTVSSPTGTDTNGSVANQIVYDVANVGSNQYFGGVFNSFNGNSSLACLALNSGGSTSAITGLSSSNCEVASPANFTSNVIFRLLVIPSLSL